MHRNILRSILQTTVVVLLLVALPCGAYGDTPDFDIHPDLPVVTYHPTITLGAAVTLQNQSAYATPLLAGPTANDLEYPMGLYINGVQGYEIERENGFVRIAIGGNGLDDGISGYVQQEHVVASDTAAATAPLATLRTDANLLHNYYEGAEVIAAYPKGTEISYLGRMEEWCHVQIGEEYGFVKLDQVDADDQITSGIAKALTPQFDNFTPQEKRAMDICGAYASEKEALYGVMDLWPLEIKAEFAALSIQLGRGQILDYGIDILPDANDLPQDKALAIAKQAIMDLHSISAQELDALQMYVNFYDSNFTRTGHYWLFTFVGNGQYLSSTISSPDGEVVFY